MTFDEYQKRALLTDILGSDRTDWLAHDPPYVAKILGLVGEAGEVAEKYKKIVRDKKGVLTKEDKTELGKELGDVLWYVAVLSSYLGIKFEDVAHNNLGKLADRKSRGVLRGKGDNR